MATVGSNIGDVDHRLEADGLLDTEGCVEGSLDRPVHLQDAGLLRADGYGSAGARCGAAIVGELASVAVVLHRGIDEGSDERVVAHGSTALAGVIEEARAPADCCLAAAG